MDKQINKIPQVRFPEFNDDWKFIHGNELFKTISNKKHDSDLPILAISQEFGAIPRHLINYNISVTENSVSSYKVVDVGDFIISLRSFQGGIEYSNYKGICSPAYIILRPTVKIETDFYKSHFKSYRYIQQLQSKLEGIRDGKMVSYKYFSEIKLPFPQLPEQQRIAHFFSIVDKKFNQLQEKLSGLEQYKKGMMQQIFSQKLRFKDENGKHYPNWEVKKLSSLTERIKSKNNIDNQNVLTISAQNGLINQLEYFNKSVSAKNLTGYYLLEKDDFAYNKSYSKDYPMGAIKRLKRYEKGVVSTLYICFRFKKESNLNFFEQYFESGLLNREIEKYAQEGARNHGLLNIGLNDFFSVAFMLPSNKEQEKISDLLSKIDDKINAVNEQIETAKIYKKGLLQKMFCN